jgi:hypothetical protein
LHADVEWGIHFSLYMVEQEHAWKP